jgi:branched-chain amino acid transport system substrate-binding protein
LPAFALLVLCALLGLARCGTAAPAAPPGDAIPGHILTIYTSLPLQGASAAGARAVLNGERLALAQHGTRIGRYTIVLRALDDDTPQSAGWDPGQTSVDAHLALADATTVGYIGDFNSGASAVAIPLLNRRGIAQISPTGSAVGLTTDGAGASPGEPAKYYPSGRRTFIQLAPNDAVQAAIQVRLQRSFGCQQTYVIDDNEFDGYDAAASFSAVAAAGGLKVVAVQSFDPRAADYTTLARTVAQAGANCVLISALPSPQTTLLTTEIAAALPNARLFALATLAQPTFTNPRRGGIPAALAPQLLLSAPVAGADATALDFAGIYQRRFGTPGPFAPYGYEAMHMLLDAIARATTNGRHPARRSKVLSALFGVRAKSSVLGPFTIARNGATTLRHYGIYAVSGGRLVLWDAVNAPGR